VPAKNIRRLGAHPVIAYSIAPAIESGIFESVIVSTDSEETAAIARHYGAEVPFLRPAQFAGDASPDIEWVEYTLIELRRGGRSWDFGAHGHGSRPRTASIRCGLSRSVDSTQARCG
jgi:CMP-N,N'-diacetyllegionaminic acid synthase